MSYGFRVAKQADGQLAVTDAYGQVPDIQWTVNGHKDDAGNASVSISTPEVTASASRSGS